LPARYRVDLLTAILAESAHILRDRYHTELVILVWNQPEGIDLIGPIHSHAIRTVDIAGLIGDTHAPGMRLRPGVDNHPAGKINAKLAAALAAMEGATTSAPPAAAK
jgi:hypothetical protein